MQIVNPGDYTRTKFLYLHMSQLPSDNSTCHSCVCDDVVVQIYSLASGNKSRGSHDKKKYLILKNKILLLYVTLPYVDYKCMNLIYRQNTYIDIAINLMEKDKLLHICSSYFCQSQQKMLYAVIIEFCFYFSS